MVHCSCVARFLMMNALNYFFPARLMCLVGTLMLIAGGAMSQSYRLQPGDVLTLRIVGLQELNGDIRIEAEGTAYFPLIGAVDVGGSTLDEVRETVSVAYTTVSNPLSNAADSAFRPIQSSQVSVTVAEYRPIYVSGVGVLPTVVPFRPGLSLKQVMTLAGASGTAASDSSVVNQSRSTALLVELARTRARIWSLKTLVGTAMERDEKRIYVADLPVIDDIAAAEKALAETRVSDLERSVDLIDQQIERARARLDALAVQRASEQAGVDLDRQITENSRFASATRLAEVRRAAIASASRVLEIDSTIAEVRSEISELEVKKASLATEQRSEALAEFAEQLTRAEQLRSELSALRVAVRTDTVDQDIVAVIYRDGEKLAPQSVEAGTATLSPGDTVNLMYAEPELSNE